ncbi:MAG: pitrilysin family protein [Candidatus Uhrbacteria bacterium]|nr:pitrilysin family protein [Candidatus Uhrbacteria bacterium]
MAIKAKKLKNGMRYHLVPFPGTDAATVLVLTKVGARYEPLKVWGGSHFIEHLMFKGTKKRPNTIDISLEIDRYGAAFNAYTGKDLTGYYVKIAGNKAHVAIDLLHDMLFNSKYAPAEMKKEKQVIIEEIKMYEENPIMHIDDLIERAMFDGNPLGREIAGTSKSMIDMKRSDLISFRDKYYIPSEMVVVIAGNVPKGAKALLEKTFGKVAQGTEPDSYLPFGDMPERKTPRVSIQYKELEQIQLALAFPAPGKHDEKTQALKIFASILGGTMSSRLFIEVREKRGLAYFVRASSEAYEDVGMLLIRAGLNRERLDEALNAIFKELKKIKREGVTVQELKFAKDHAEGAAKLSLEDSSNRAEFYGRQELFFDKVETLDEKLTKIREVTVKDVQDIANEILNFQKLSIAAVGPYKTDAALLKHVPVIN